MIPLSDHFDGRRYVNPGGANGRPLRDVARMLREKRARWPRALPDLSVRPEPLPEAVAVRATFVGHSTFLIQSRSGNILTDPVYARRASPVRFAGPRRVRAPAVPFEALPPIAMVLLSHNHYDHADLATLGRLERRFAPRFVTAAGNAPLLRRAGAGRVVELDWWEETDDRSIMATPAQHFSGRTLGDRNRTLWAGFVLRLGSATVFFAGDTGYGPHFQAIRERAGAIDLAFLPIGAYEPRWFMKDFHMNPDEAVQAHLDLQSRRSVGMHFGTFQLTTESIDAPVTALGEAMTGRGVAAEEFVAPGPGAIVEIPA